MSPNSGESSEDAPDLGPAPQRLTVDVETVCHLVAEQFPQWSKRPITPVSNPGWDNFTFHLGDDMLVRLPSAAEYALAVEKEHRSNDSRSDDSTWARGRGWALWKSLRHLANAMEDHDETSEAETRLIIDAILEDYTDTR